MASINIVCVDWSSSTAEEEREKVVVSGPQIGWKYT